MGVLASRVVLGTPHPTRLVTRPAVRCPRPRRADGSRYALALACSLSGSCRARAGTMGRRTRAHIPRPGTAYPVRFVVGLGRVEGVGRIASPSLPLPLPCARACTSLRVGARAGRTETWRVLCPFLSIPDWRARGAASPTRSRLLWTPRLAFVTSSPPHLSPPLPCLPFLPCLPPPTLLTPSSPPGETWNVLKIGFQLKQLRERLAKGLVDKGVLRTEKRNFLLFEMATRPVADAHVKAGVVNRVVALLTSGTSAMERTEGRGGGSERPFVPHSSRQAPLALACLPVSFPRTLAPLPLPRLFDANLSLSHIPPSLSTSSPPSPFFLIPLPLLITLTPHAFLLSISTLSPHN
ncbi:hypothetical protein DFH08DRAFT_1089575 [Mycena albidolilacea]|uniref:Uncharacterized protein n=1 Tax=Mycena albidolilacea TaxID=1033008 RepID=A0AAD6Z0G6_9AGAR|nr:hypothetical protein DFH08DRAFT_1089575 [Mycena albidolilacea]